MRTKRPEWRSYPIQCPDCGHVNRGAFPPPELADIAPLLWDACASCGHLYKAEIVADGDETTIRVSTGKTIEQVVKQDKITKVIL